MLDVIPVCTGWLSITGGWHRRTDRFTLAVPPTDRLTDGESCQRAGITCKLFPGEFPVGPGTPTKGQSETVEETPESINHPRNNQHVLFQNNVRHRTTSSGPLVKIKTLIKARSQISGTGSKFFLLLGNASFLCTDNLTLMMHKLQFTIFIRLCFATHTRNLRVPTPTRERALVRKSTACVRVN